MTVASAVQKRERHLLSLVGVLAGTWLAIQIVGELWRAFAVISDVVLIFIVAWAVAFLLGPLVGRLDRLTRLNRVGGVGVVYLGIAVLLTTILAVIIPGLAAQLMILGQRGPEYGDRAARMVTDMQAVLTHAGLQVDLTQLYGALPARLGELAASSAGDALGFVSAAAGLLFDIVLVLIIAFLMLIDGDRLWTRFTKALSEELQSEAELLRQSIDKSFGGFIRGSLLIGLVYGVLTLVTLAPLGVPFAEVLAVIAGLAVTIPFFGPIIAIIPIAVIALLGSPDRFILVMVITLVVQQIMFNVVSPRILSNSVGLHPLVVFAALLIGVRVAGFWGVFLALPVTGIGAVFVRYVYELSRGRLVRTEAAELITPEDSAG
jgi:predicted PurR-regulated permease PerM